MKDAKQLPDNLKEIVDNAKKRIKEDATTPEKALSTLEIVDLIKELKEKGKDVLSEQTIKQTPQFDAVSRHWEKMFWEDMKKLNVKFPTVITRVTEYIPDIIDYVKKIMENGFAYESGGSVYFDTEAFGKHKDHNYGKLEPWSVGNTQLAIEGEGEWAKQKKVSEKKTKNDFALWKKSNPGEPAWESPWGLGRPGWHIECSAMASHILGDTLDVHCGGEDLRFPHHDNELAQSEAYYQHKQWVNYFFHTGHLHIDGRTMSKSKKNFITIKEALETYTPRQIRMLYLLYRFNDPMDYSKGTMDQATYMEKL